MKEEIKVEITSPADIYIAEFRAKKLIEKYNLNIKSLLLVVRELSTNVLKHGGGGELRIKLNSQKILIVTENKKVELGKRSGLRIGLEVVRRNVDELEIEESEDGRWIVRASILLSSEKAPLIEYGYAFRPHYLETESGDLFKIKKLNNKYLVVVADVLGHGKKAKEIADLIANYVDQFKEGDLFDFFSGLEKVLWNTRGCVAFFGFVTLNRLEYCLIGNIRGWIVSYKQVRLLKGQEGIIGRMPISLKVFYEDISLKDERILLVTDGIKSRFMPTDAMYMLSMDPVVASRRLLDEFSIENDDALVAIISRRGR